MHCGNERGLWNAQTSTASTYNIVLVSFRTCIRFQKQSVFCVLTLFKAHHIATANEYAENSTAESNDNDLDLSVEVDMERMCAL